MPTIGQMGVPQPVFATGADEFGAGQDLGAMFGGIDRVGERQAGIVDKGVEIDETLPAPAQRRAICRVRSTQSPRSRQARAPTQRIIEIQPSANQPPGADDVVIRQNERHRTDEVWCSFDQPLAFHQRLAHQSKT